VTEKGPEYAIVPHTATDIVTTFDDVVKIGEIMSRSGYFTDAKGAAQAVVKILAGREMGFGPFAAMNGVHIIKGKPTVGANLMAAAVKNHPRYDYRVTQMDDGAVAVTFYQHGEPLGTSTFTMDNAKAAKLTGRDNWRNYPRNMLFARAMSNGVRWYCPDVFAGNAVYTPDELAGDAPAPTWDVVNGGVETVTEADVQTKAAEAAQVLDEALGREQESDNGKDVPRGAPSGDGRQEFWHAYHTEAKPAGIAQQYAQNIAKKYGEAEDGDWGKALSRLYDAVAEKQS